MSSNPSLYRYVDFIGGNILDASNVLLLQTELGRTGTQGLGQLYAQGTLLNGVFNITGTSIVFTGANPSLHVFGFINGQFEDLGATITIAGVQPVTGASNPLYLEWSWDIKTNADDATFVDGVTGEPTIEAGQLSFVVTWGPDTSGIALNPSTQFGKNTSPIVLATFDMSVPGAVTPTYINGVSPYAWGNPKQAGFVRLTDNSGLAPGNTDVRLTNARNPNPGSVFDVSVAPLISSGTNATTLPAWIATHVYTVGTQIVDSNGNVQTVISVAGTGTSAGVAPTWNVSLGGSTFDNPGGNQVVWVNGGTASTTKYDPATINQGGIFSNSIIYTTLKQKLTTFLDSVNTSVQNALIALANHIGQPLGSSETHPFPTAFQVGAAPSSHVGQVLGLGTSHPAQVNSDTAGFVVLRNFIASANDSQYAYNVNDGVNIIAALTHAGNVYARQGLLYNAQGGNGSGGTAINTGTLGFLSQIAAVLAEHVNYKTHGNNNPHNLNAADVGSVSAAFVDAQISSVVSDVTSYTDAKTTISVRTVTTVGGLNGAGFHSPSGTHSAQMAWPPTHDTITHLIVTIGGSFEIAFGLGSYQNGSQVALPESSGWVSTPWLGMASMAWMETTSSYEGGRGEFFKAYVDPVSRIVNALGTTDSGSQFLLAGIASVLTLSYRNITPPPIVINSFDSTAGTFNAGHVGDSVTITGRNFGSVRGTSTVTFNGTAVVTYSSWSSTSLIVVVPAGATSGLIVVTVPPSSGVPSSFVFSIS